MAITPGDAHPAAVRRKREHRRLEDLEHRGEEIGERRAKAAVDVEEERVIARDRQQSQGAEPECRLIRIQPAGL